MNILDKLSRSTEVPAGWKHIWQLMEEAKVPISKTVARELVNQGIRSGTVEAKKFRVLRKGMKRPSSMFHYREVPEKTTNTKK